LDDAWVDVERVTQERPDEAETDRLIGGVKSSIDEMERLLGQQL